jgi:hypothetical protein
MRYPERRGRVISRSVRGTACLAFARFWQNIGRMDITTCGYAGRDQNGRAVARVSAR